MPRKKGFNLVLWISPFVFMAFAATVIYFLIRRWSTKRQREPDVHLDKDQLSEYEERLEKELKQFDQGL
jgi:cytochrome c-type biogenesis protein CcmH/NrfF